VQLIYGQTMKFKSYTRKSVLCEDLRRDFVEARVQYELTVVIKRLGKHSFWKTENAKCLQEDLSVYNVLRTFILNRPLKRTACPAVCFSAFTSRPQRRRFLTELAQPSGQTRIRDPWKVWFVIWRRMRLLGPKKTISHQHHHQCHHRFV